MATASCDCDLLNFNLQNNTATGGTSAAVPRRSSIRDATRFGADPLSLDEAGTPIGLTTTQCGRSEAGHPADGSGATATSTARACSMGGAGAVGVAVGLGNPARNSCRALRRGDLQPPDYAMLTVTDTSASLRSVQRRAGTCGHARMDI